MHYHWLSVLSVLSAVLPADLATPPTLNWGDKRVKHTWNSVPEGWESLGAPPAGTTIDLHLALKPHHENALIDALYQVSDPRHQRYGAHLTREQVADLVAPHQDTLKIVHSWLEHHGVPPSSISTSHGGGWLTITGVPVSQADEFLCASYQLYRHTGSGETETFLRTVGYALPAALHGHVETVAPTTHFASPRMPPQRGSREEAAVTVNASSGELVRVLSKRRDVVTPSFLRWLYRTGPYVPTAMGQNVLGILGVHTGIPIQADLTRFMTDYRAEAAAATFTTVQVNGGGFGNTDPVASVNTQYAEAIAYPTPHIFYSAGGRLQWSHFSGGVVSDDAYLEWLNYLLAQSNIPQTISIAYADTELGFPPEYSRALCKLFARLGTRGVSILVASGDEGVGHGDCKSRSGNVRFLPTFPASYDNNFAGPWVTSVGGTTGNPMRRESEVAVSFSGGGFSYYFDRPSYQGRALSSYLESLGTKKYAGLYQPKGRGIPDIAAQAHQFSYFQVNFPRVASSTSCSTPAVAGIVSLLNDYRLSTGKAPLGFLNPWLYEGGLGGLNDITSGSNPGCDTDGFHAISGWDPVTGLGSLDFEKLQRLLDSRCDLPVCVINE